MISSVSAFDVDNETLTSDCDTVLADNSSEEVLLEQSDIHSFDELSGKINSTPENQTLVLENDYQYVNGSDKGIVISKSITIDGAGHTLDAKKSSRMFNITADNVVLKNILFKNGNALGSYSTYYGGGAIYWNGTNGHLENCTFSGNSALGVDYDPYIGDEVIESDSGITTIIHHERPLGRTINQGGAITWAGDGGTVSNCTFMNNHVAYPDDGGAIFWKGKNGKIINSKFLNNGAYRGCAVYWSGINGTILSSVFSNSGICDDGIFWTGANGTIKNSVLLGQGSRSPIYVAGNNLIADYNFWGDTIENPNQITKIGGLNNWILLNLTSNKNFVYKDEEFLVNYDLTTLIDKNSKMSKYYGLKNSSGQISYTANRTSYVTVLYENNQIKVNLVPMGSFDELALLINATPEGGVLVLDSDYKYINGSNKGILISKSITIDGAGHTLDGCKLSRMFNVTADNVTIRNFNFVNGNAFGRYYAVAGGGVIYWYGANGLVENCNFINNTGSGIEDDPFDKEETFIDEDGRVWFIYRARPMGAKINEGGAIVWNGTNGVVSNCVFINNQVGYPNTGGAICWRGDNGTVIGCEFYKNGAWCGAAVAWIGDNGLICNSIISNSSLFDGIYWFGHNGTITNSILLDFNARSSLRPYDADVNADYNFWGDTVDEPNQADKIANVDKWVVMKFTHNGEYVKKGQKILIEYDLTTLMDKNGKTSKYNGINYKIGQLTYTAAKNGYLKISYVQGVVKVEIDTKDKIKSRDLTAYYSNQITYKVTVSDVNGKVSGKNVKFTVNKKTYNVKTDKKGVATLKIKLKPGKYTIYSSYNKVKVKNKITIKSTLITKDMNVKAKKAGKFTVKVLNSKGKAYSKQSVKVNFKGKNYKLKTNKKGIATFSVSKNLKVGKYTIKTTYNGITNSNKITVKK